jgi:hypothetical protein
MNNLCIDCKIGVAVAANYCEDCMDAMMESYENSIIADSLEEESNYDLQLGTTNSSLTNGSMNREDRVYRLNPQLGCTYCKPHRGENTSWSWKFNGRRSSKKKIAKERRQGSEFKKKQLED